MGFQSTRPIQASTTIILGRRSEYGISIHEAYTGLDDLSEDDLNGLIISIHEAYTGLDLPYPGWPYGNSYFNPRGLYRPRPMGQPLGCPGEGFQSTRPIQASTSYTVGAAGQSVISIHEAYTGLDEAIPDGITSEKTFQSTRPIQASTSQDKLEASDAAISIHEAYTGLDANGYIFGYIGYISIHEAYTGLDRVPWQLFDRELGFQSTRPIQASTVPWQLFDRELGISIHEAYTGLDRMCTRCTWTPR